MAKLKDGFLVSDVGNYFVYKPFFTQYGGGTSYRVSKNNPNKIEECSWSSSVGFINKGWVDSSMNAKQFNRMLRKSKIAYRQRTSFFERIQHMFINFRMSLSD